MYFVDIDRMYLLNRLWIHTTVRSSRGPLTVLVVVREVLQPEVHYCPSLEQVVQDRLRSRPRLLEHERHGDGESATHLSRRKQLTV